MDKIDKIRILIQGDNLILVLMALVKLIVHLVTNLSGGYGIFRDEFNYIACSKHLAWGYYENNLPVWICKQLRTSLQDDWQEFEHYE